MVSNDFITEMERKIGSKPRHRVYFYPKSKEGGSPDYVDLSEYYAGLSPIDQEKEKSRSELAAGDVTIRFENKDNYFCDRQSNSVFYGEDYYHNREIKIWEGFVLPDSTIEWALQFTGLITEVEISLDGKYAYVVCQDAGKDLIQGSLNIPASNMIPTPGTSNVGDGNVSDIATLPFKTKTESWTLTCTTAGGSGVGKFSVVGSVSGNVGEAIAGTEFSTGTGAGGVKFTIYAGDTDYALNDSFTFSTRQYPEYTSQNLSDVIKDLLEDTTYGLSLPAGRINTTSFNNAKTAITKSLGNVTGYVPFNSNAATYIQHLLQLFFGALYTNTNGELCLKAWAPTWGTPSYDREFSRSRKIQRFGYRKLLKDVINQITVYYRHQASWAWSDEAQGLDGMYPKKDDVSIGRYGKRPYPENDGVLSSYWLNAIGAQQIADRIIDRYANPPYRPRFDTRLDALDSEIGDFAKLVDSDAVFDDIFEIVRTGKDLQRKDCALELISAEFVDWNWAFLGSSANEGDGISPQASNYDAASASDKQFCYLSQDGGEGSDPEYYLW